MSRYVSTMICFGAAVTAKAHRCSGTGHLRSDVDINHSARFVRESVSGIVDLGRVPVESNLRYYHRRAAEERMAAQRAITDNAREWHAKLAQQFAARAAECEGRAAVA